jgi:hypothetical protein
MHLLRAGAIFENRIRKYLQSPAGTQKKSLKALRFPENLAYE